MGRVDACCRGSDVELSHAALACALYDLSGLFRFPPFSLLFLLPAVCAPYPQHTRDRYLLASSRLSSRRISQFEYLLFAFTCADVCCFVLVSCLFFLSGTPPPPLHSPYPSPSPSPSLLLSLAPTSRPSPTHSQLRHRGALYRFRVTRPSAHLPQAARCEPFSFFVCHVLPVFPACVDAHDPLPYMCPLGLSSCVGVSHSLSARPHPRCLVLMLSVVVRRGHTLYLCSANSFRVCVCLPLHPISASALYEPRPTSPQVILFAARPPLPHHL